MKSALTKMSLICQIIMESNSLILIRPTLVTKNDYLDFFNPRQTLLSSLRVISVLSRFLIRQIMS